MAGTHNGHRKSDDDTDDHCQKCNKQIIQTFQQPHIPVILDKVVIKLL